MELDNNTTNTINNNQTIFAINNNVINNVGDRLDYNEAVQIPLPFRRNVAAQNGSRLDDSNHQEDIEILYQDIANLGGFIVNNQYDETDQDLNNSQAPLSPRSIAQELKSSLNTRGSPIYTNNTITNISRPTSSDSSIENDYKLLAAASPNFSNTSPQPSSQQSPFTASDSACSSVGPYLAFYGSDETNTKTTTTASNDFYLNESKMPKSPKTVKKRKTSSSSSMSSSPPSSLVPQKLPLRDHQENMIVDSRANKRPNTTAISSNLEDALGREELRLDNLTLKQEAIQYFDEYAANGGISGALNQKSNRTIVFNNWNESNWVNLFSNDYKLIPRPDFKVEADKGFSYSIFDEAFVCQKKNHFQITAYTFVESQPFYCRKTTTSSDEYHEISSFRLRLYGVKEESPKQTIEIRKSDSDRKPLEFEPPEYPMMGGVENKLTQMRLHFAHTTSNNNRKRDMKSGRVVPNPDQRYFLLVVELEAVTTTGLAFCVCSAASERVIVRAVNPGQFRPRESSIDEVSQADVDLSIPKTSPAILAAACAEASQITTFQGKVGINTLNPEEALSVIGNIKLSGLILQPSDMRIKENIKPVDPNNALEKLKKIKIYKYDFKQEFVDINGGVKSDMGVLAQEVREIIPEAVVETRDVQLSNGEVVEKFLHVDKNRLHMECMGAVIALEDKTQHLNKKIDYLENRFPIDSNVSSSKNANNKDKNSKNIFKNCNPKRVKLIISIAAILIALGVLGILIVEILRHINEKQKSAAPNNSTNNHGGNPYYYPLISPPVFGQAVCNSSFLAPGRPRPSCTQYCCPQDNDMSTTGMYSTTSSTRPSLSPPAKKIVFPNFNIQFNMSDIRATGISSVGVLGLGLYVADPLLFINLAFNGMCTLPYCEQIDGINFIFVPISSTIDVETDIFVVFIMKNGYWVRFCNYDQNGNECHELSTGQTTPAQMPTNIQRTNYSLYSQNVFQTSVSKFLHIDFTFRTVNDASANACVMNDTSNLNSNVRFQEYIIRFYRIC